MANYSVHSRHFLAVIIGLQVSIIISAQSSSSSILTFSTLRRAVVTISGNVIVSDDNTVYLLNGDLTEVTRRVRNEGQSPEGMTLTSDESRLIVCWANAMDSSGQLVNTAPCTIYNSSTLEGLVNVTKPATGLGVGAPRGNSYSVSRGSSGVGRETFFVMSSSFSGGNDNELYHCEYSVSDGSVRRQEIPTAEGITNRRYITGITVGNYSYVLAFDARDESVRRVRVIRLCDGRTSWDNWYEIQLNCGRIKRLLDFRSTLLDANFLTVEDGVSEAMLMITVESETGASDTCSFSLSDIDSIATRLLEHCQDSTVDSSLFPWINGGIVNCEGASVSEMVVHVCCFLNINGEFHHIFRVVLHINIDTPFHLVLHASESLSQHLAVLQQVQ